jgi:NADPH:quinone reductase-like Zn-dependent oxidoreductase
MSKAMVLTEYGPASVLQWQDVEKPEPGPGEIRIRVRAAGVGPTDVAIRAGHLQHAFPLEPGAVLGFEAAGVVDALGASVTGVAVGDPVIALLQAHLGGYGEYAVTPVWSPKPEAVSWIDAAALPASAEAAVRGLHELHVERAEMLLILGAAGSVGLIATQLAVAAGIAVIGSVADADFETLRSLGATPVSYRGDLLADVRATGASIDAVLDAAGKGGLAEAIELAGGPGRVLTLSDPGGPALGVPISSPVPDVARDVLDPFPALLTDGHLRLRPRRALPATDAAAAHALIEAGTREKLVLVFDD